MASICVDGVCREMTEEEYNRFYGDPPEDVDDSEALEILLGGGAE